MLCWVHPLLSLVRRGSPGFLGTTVPPDGVVFRRTGMSDGRRAALEFSDQERQETAISLFPRGGLPRPSLPLAEAKPGRPEARVLAGGWRCPRAVADFLYFPGKPESVLAARGKVKQEGTRRAGTLPASGGSPDQKRRRSPAAA